MGTFNLNSPAAGGKTPPGIGGGYYMGKNGDVQRFASAHEAGLFGYTRPVSEEERTGITRPSFLSMVDPATGRLQDKFTLSSGETLLPYAENQLKDINLDTRALEELRTRALSQGPSKFTQLALEKQMAEEAGQLDRATREGQGAATKAMSDLSMYGGVSGGERERIGYQSARDIAEGRQGVSRQGVADRFNINLQDEDTKLNLLQAIPGLEATSTGTALKKAELLGRAKESDIGRKMDADRFNIGLLSQDTSSRNAFNMNEYSDRMKQWATEQEAEATKKSGGSHICTAVHREYEITEDKLNDLDRFRAEAMEYFPEVFKFYLTKCESLIPRMRERGADVGMLRPFVNLVFKYMEKYGSEYALDFYADYTLELVKIYMPELYEEARTLLHKSGSH